MFETSSDGSFRGEIILSEKTRFKRDVGHGLKNILKRPLGKEGWLKIKISSSRPEARTWQHRLCKCPCYDHSKFIAIWCVVWMSAHRLHMASTGFRSFGVHECYSIRKRRLNIV